jgi:hypothetical protein
MSSNLEERKKTQKSEKTQIFEKEPEKNRKKPAKKVVRKR